MQLSPIKTEGDHDTALREIERLWGAEEGTTDGSRLDILATLVESYEELQFSAGMSDTTPHEIKT